MNRTSSVPVPSGSPLLEETLEEVVESSGWVLYAWVLMSNQGLGQLEYPDTVAGRRRHLEWLEGCVDWKDPETAGDELPQGQSLQATFRRGWYFGSEAFREKLVELLGRQEPSVSKKRRKGISAAQNRDHGITEARRILALAEQEFDLTDWSSLKKGDWRKGLVAGMIRQRSLVPNSWLAEELHMGVPNAVSRSIRLAREQTSGNRRMHQIARRLERQIGTE